MAKISIAVPVHNAQEHVSKLLECFDNSEARYVEKVFVNDSSDEHTTEMLLEYCSNRNCQYLYNDKQQLFTRSLNRAIRACQPNTDLYVCVNTDCELKPGWLNRLVSAYEKHPKSAIIGYPDGSPNDGEGEQQAFYPSVPDHPDYITGHCFLVPKQAFKDIGVLCETDINQAHIASERLWCWRAAKKGYEMYYVNSNLCVHDSGGPSWNRDLGWLYSFDYSTLWAGNDML